MTPDNETSGISAEEGISWQIYDYDVLDSTSTKILELIATCKTPPHGMVVRAKQQTQGRGRLGRAWESPVGNLYQSCIVQPDVALSKGFGLAFVTAVAIYDALKALGAGHGLGLKWPNDVFLDDKKVAGILIEAGPVRQMQPQWYCIGIGVNIATCPKDLVTGTSLKAKGLDLEVEKVADAFRHHFSLLYTRWLSKGFEDIRHLWLDRCIFIGKRIEAGPPEQRFQGMMKDLANDGALVLETPAGLRYVTTGEVTLIK